MTDQYTLGIHTKQTSHFEQFEAKPNDIATSDGEHGRTITVHYEDEILLEVFVPADVPYTLEREG